MKFSGVFFLTLIMVTNTGFTGNKQTYTYKVTTKEFMLNGPYSSWYKNGQIKAEGEFFKNQRIGNWKVYDSTGILLIKRLYSNSFVFEIENFHTKPPSHPNPFVEKYDLIKNDTGYFEYPGIKEEEVVVSKRIWRKMVPNSGNSIFFDDNALFTALLPHLLSQKITVYSPLDDEFTIKLDSQQVNDACILASFNVAGFKIKEEWFYSSKRQMSEIRILGICPYIEIEGVKRDLFWLYYPQIRNALAQVEVSFGKEEELIENMEDVFFFRRFSSEIYKESNLYDKSISDYTPAEDVPTEAERIEVSMIEMEHDIWIKNAQ